MKRRKVVGFLLLLGLVFLAAACQAETQQDGVIELPPDSNVVVEEEALPTVAATPTLSLSLTAVPDASEPTPTKIAPEAPANVQPVGTAVPVTPIVGEVPADLMTTIMDDAIERTSTTADQITVLQSEFVIWPDGSLGCPQPGMAYTQALVEGYRIVLEIDGETYDYHTSERGFFVLCEGGLSDNIPPVISTPTE